MERDNFHLNGNPDDPSKLLTEPVRRSDGRLVRASVFLNEHFIELKIGSLGIVYQRDFIANKWGGGSYIDGLFILCKLALDPKNEEYKYPHKY